MILLKHWCHWNLVSSSSLGFGSMIPIFFLATLCLGAVSAAPTRDPSLDAVWQEWKTKHGKTYHMVGTIEMSRDSSPCCGKFIESLHCGIQFFPSMITWHALWTLMSKHPIAIGSGFQLPLVLIICSSRATEGARIGLDIPHTVFIPE